MTNTLLAQLRRREKIDWRYPDEYGFSERNLDCLQLSILEILKWKGESNLFPIFLDAFDCRADGLLLRRTLSCLQHGFKMIQYPSLSREQTPHLLRSFMDGEGYALVHYKAYYAPFSSYYKKHDVIHWALIIDMDEEYITIIDDAGSSAFFTHHMGKIPTSLFFDTFTDPIVSGGMAIVRETEVTMSDADHINKLLQQSVKQMMHQDGLQQLQAYVHTVSQTSSTELISHLDMLEFDIHYFRRLRELWSTAIEQRVLPNNNHLQPLAILLQQVCQSWAFIVGLLIKWKVQTNKDYKPKLVSLLHQVLDDEQMLFLTMQSVVEEKA
ncbi:hypothetical protein [Longirhabdus pacifica]|uniref:hypothetical protein n=1 Tax=Longirhabdus pacifica TaxID=2305227 RepID=UPI001008E5DB|nr:hypothetical protein [Longirhabdus pacifica]